MDIITTIINNNLDIERKKDNLKLFPKQFKKTDVIPFLASEFLFSNSPESSYSNFRKSNESSKNTLGTTKFYQIRKLLLDLATTDDVMLIQNTLFKRAKDVWKCRGEQVVDELLSAWTSEKYSENITYIPRKPHPYGLCYYFRVNRLHIQETSIIFCVDMVDSVKLPKTSAIEAAKELLNGIIRDSGIVSPIVVMDSAFYSQDMIKWLILEGHLFIISGGANKYPLITSYAKKYLIDNTHIMFTDKQNLCYSYTNAVHFNANTMEVTDTGTLRVAVTNAFEFEGDIPCECISSKEKGFAEEYSNLSNGALCHLINIMGKKTGNPYIS